METNYSLDEIVAKNKSRLSTPGAPHLRLSERRLLLSLVDIVIVNGALMIAVAARTDIRFTASTVLELSKWFLTLTAVWFVAASIFDCYHLPRASHAAHSVRAAGGAALLAIFIYTLTPWLTPPLISRSLLLIFVVTALAGIFAWRLLYARIFAQSWTKQRALIIGAGHAGREVARIIQHPTSGTPNPYRDSGYTAVGFIDANPDFQNTVVEEVPVLGDHDTLLVALRRLQVDEIILAITHRHAISDELFSKLIECSQHGYRVTTMATFYARVLGRVPVEHVGHDLNEVLPTGESAGGRLYRSIKRTVDILVAIPALVVLALIMPAVAVANRFGSSGPLFYRQERVGLHGKPFTIIKFRSMVPDAEQGSGAVWAQAGDTRITPVGRWLRRSRLDELPQFLNILRGEMSLIGPRPERPEFVAQLTQMLPWYAVRHQVRPGLTGWAQVQFRYGNSAEDARIKLEYDLYYVKNMTPGLDMQILFRTVAIAVQMKGT
jgi:exopolysaccharide biosynthesis polyprenyl glycosylphosphotransferase